MAEHGVEGDWLVTTPQSRALALELDQRLKAALEQGLPPEPQPLPYAELLAWVERLKESTHPAEDAEPRAVDPA